MENTTKKKEFFLLRWFKRMFLGSSRELTVSDERYDSPGKLAVKRFFRKPLATAAVVVLLLLFLFVFIGPIFAPVDLSYRESMHANVGPNNSMMAIPKELKNGTSSISSRGSFSLGLSDEGKLFTWGGAINLKNEKYKLDERPIDERCDCPTCRNFSRAYLRHLFKADEMLALRLAVMHNLYFYNKLAERIRDALDAGEFAAFRAEYSEKLSERA